MPATKDRLPKPLNRQSSKWTSAYFPLLSTTYSGNRPNKTATFDMNPTANKAHAKQPPWLNLTVSLNWKAWAALTTRRLYLGEKREQTFRMGQNEIWQIFGLRLSLDYKRQLWFRWFAQNLAFTYQNTIDMGSYFTHSKKFFVYNSSSIANRSSFQRSQTYW